MVIFGYLVIFGYFQALVLWAIRLTSCFVNSTVDAVINAEPETIETAVARCNYRRTKAKYVMACANEIRVRYGGKVPRQVAGLTRLPGVGPKIAHLGEFLLFPYLQCE